MVTIPLRSVQAVNLLLSSGIVIFMSAGVIIETWVELNLETKNPRSHSPWLYYGDLWPEDDMKFVRTLMISVFSLAFIHNLFLGLEYSYMIPETKYLHLIPTLLGLVTGGLHLCALVLYHQKLIQGVPMYYSSYKITWVTFTTYFNAFCSAVSGVLSFLPHISSTCLKFTHTSSEESLVMQESTSSIKVVTLPERTAMPRSIVRVHSGDVKPHVPTRRVTWAL
ncbi:transmembrane protein 225 isoform X2 [Erinaceus europaeus]|uniref:Transmembrane protein 225 isoform X2 n=1 Tax=Erinaceus europaeus TaxID=9365 RepID=A0A1S3A476_ERIEU|nr:transmembrane protein 225 isoform X2 [Erinaceus europaeus]